MKRLFYGLTVAAIALGTSAFTNLPDTTVAKATRVGGITANYLVQPQPGLFSPFRDAGVPNPSLCGSRASRQCFYSITPSGKDHLPDKSEYTQAELDLYVNNGWLAPGPDSTPNKLYMEL